MTTDFEGENSLDIWIAAARPGPALSASDDAFAQALANRWASGSLFGQSRAASDVEDVLSAPLPDDQPASALARKSEKPRSSIESRKSHTETHSTHGPRNLHDHAANAADHDATEALASWEGTMTDDSSTGGNRGLEGLARLSRSASPSMPPPSGSPDGQAQGDDSGLINLKAMTEPEAPKVAAPPPPDPESGKISLVQAEKPESKVKQEKAPLPSAAAAGAALAVASAASEKEAGSATAPSIASAPKAPTEQKKSGAVYIMIGGLAVAAAVVFFVMNQKKADAEKPAASTAAGSVEEAKVAVAPSASAAPSPSIVAAAATAPPVESAVPSASASASVSASAPLVAAAGKVEAKTPPGAAPPAAPPVAPSASTKVAAADPPKAPGSAGLDDALGIKKGEPKVEKVEKPGADLPDKPDRAEVTSQVNGKLGAAAACVKGLDGPTKVSIKFGASGAVDSVTVTSGPAKGTGAETCIQGAFKAAKVPPSRTGATGFATLNP